MSFHIVCLVLVLYKTELIKSAAHTNRETYIKDPLTQTKRVAATKLKILVYLYTSVYLSISTLLHKKVSRFH